MGGNAHGIHSMKGVVGALCGGVPGGAAAPYCKPVPCKPVPCINQLCTPQPCLVATGSGGSSAPGSDAGGPSDAGEGDAAAGSPPLKALLPVKTRWSIPAILEREKLQTGAELGVQARLGAWGRLPGFGHATREGHCWGVGVPSHLPSHHPSLPPHHCLQRGIFAEQVLKGWPSATRYYLIDAWQHQANYTDVANVGAAEQEARFQEARARMAPWLQKVRWKGGLAGPGRASRRQGHGSVAGDPPHVFATRPPYLPMPQTLPRVLSLPCLQAVFFRNYTTEAAALIPDASLDFIYVDAR